MHKKFENVSMHKMFPLSLLIRIKLKLNSFKLILSFDPFIMWCFESNQT